MLVFNSSCYLIQPKHLKGSCIISSKYFSFNSMLWVGDQFIPLAGSLKVFLKGLGVLNR
jgi:hypothetical protein